MEANEYKEKYVIVDEFKTVTTIHLKQIIVETRNALIALGYTREDANFIIIKCIVDKDK